MRKEPKYCKLERLGTFHLFSNSTHIKNRFGGIIAPTLEEGQGIGEEVLLKGDQQCRVGQCSQHHHIDHNLVQGRSDQMERSFRDHVDDCEVQCLEQGHVETRGEGEEDAVWQGRFIGTLLDVVDKCSGDNCQDDFQDLEHSVFRSEEGQSLTRVATASELGTTGL